MVFKYLASTVESWFKIDMTFSFFGFCCCVFYYCCFLSLEFHIADLKHGILLTWIPECGDYRCTASYLEGFSDMLILTNNFLPPPATPKESALGFWVVASSGLSQLSTYLLIINSVTFTHEQCIPATQLWLIQYRTILLDCRGISSAYLSIFTELQSREWR